MENLQYPIGRFRYEQTFTDGERQKLIEEIARTPEQLRKAVQGLTDVQLDTPYRPGGWTLRQVVHHVPDSHLNSYIRFKLALTEEQPIVKPYDENRWAEMYDVTHTPVEVSLSLLESLHYRWVVLLRSLDRDDFLKTLHHPENGIMNLDRVLGVYAWHGQHHVAHITSLRERMGW